MPDLSDLNRAETLSATSPDEAINILEALINAPFDPKNADEVSDQEQARYKLGKLYSTHGGQYTQKLAELIMNTRPFLQHLSKAKSGKLVRGLINNYLDAKHEDPEVAVKLVEDSIAWCQEEKRTFLRQALQARLIGLLLDIQNYTQAIKLCTTLVRELKKLDDKALLVEVQLLESKSYHRLHNMSKARAALTSARTSANAIYCPPSLQGALDLQSGILHAEDKDFKTAYSYFYEAFENYDSIESHMAMPALKYMLLCKIMLNLPDDVHSIISGKLALKYRGSDIEAMRTVATAHHERSLEAFEKALDQYKTELSEDPIIATHLKVLYTTMLEQNLCRLIEPFSRVEIAHIAGLIKLQPKVVEATLSRMILDKKLNAILDQGEGCLLVFDDVPVADPTYTASLDTITSMGKVVDALYRRAQRLS